MFFTTVLAADEQAASGGFNPMMIVLLLLVVLMVFMMFRNRKKAQQQQEQRKTQLVPGAKVMTTAGIFGTVRSVDVEANRVVLEVSPGQDLTFHVQAVNTFVEDPAEPADAAPYDSPADAAAARGAFTKDDPKREAPEYGELRDTRPGHDDDQQDGPDGQTRRD